MNTALVRKNSKRVKLIIATIITIVLLVVGGTLISHKIYSDNLKPVNGSQKYVIVTIPSGSSLKDTAHILKDKGLIRAQWAFEQYVRNQDLQGSIKAGTYALQPSQDAQEITSAITEGRVKTDLITILPGSRIDQIKKTFVEDGFTQADVNKAFNANLYRDHPALADMPSGVTSLEGYLYPNSFQKTADTKAQDIIRESLDEMQQHLTTDIRSGFAAQGLTVNQGIILASIVEQEVSKTSDRSQAAQVFLKRLKVGMPLGSDVTVIYGAIAAGLPPSLEYNSAYNTHLHKGLPVGPISNVSQSSLEAVAHPASTDWLYFVSGDNGVTYFSKTLAEHQALTAEHCKQLCAQN